jgi:hypothetical protein
MLQKGNFMIPSKDWEEMAFTSIFSQDGQSGASLPPSPGAHAFPKRCRVALATTLPDIDRPAMTLKLYENVLDCAGKAKRRRRFSVWRESGTNEFASRRAILIARAPVWF